MELWSLEHRTKIVELYFKTGSIVLAQRAFKRELHRRDAPSKMSILRYVYQFRTEGSVAPKHRIRSPTVRTIETIAAVSEAIQRSPRKSVRRLSQQIGKSRSSVHRILKKDLLLFPYKIQCVQELKEKDARTRMEFSNAFLRLCENDMSVIDNLFMSDEAHFHLNGYVNKQNFRFWSNFNPHELHEKPLHSEKVTVWCAISAKFIVGPYFFEEKGETLTVTSDRYLAMLKDFFIPELSRLNVNLANTWFQQDGATSHTARKCMDFLRQHFPSKIFSRFGDIAWPPRSPDLTAPDYFLWGYLKSKVYTNRPTNREELKAAISQCISEVSMETLQAVMNNALVRCRECCLVNGQHLKSVIFRT